jgi:hypothetical protein
VAAAMTERGLLRFGHGAADILRAKTNQAVNLTGIGSVSNKSKPKSS